MTRDVTRTQAAPPPRAWAWEVFRPCKPPLAGPQQTVPAGPPASAIFRKSLDVRCLALGLWLTMAVLAVSPARADVLVATNGERFVGKVIAETNGIVVFQSELGGRLKLPRTRIRELQRQPSTGSAGTSQITNPPPLVTNQLSTLHPPLSVSSWRPPGIGTNGSDWIQLESGEWLRGRLKYIQQKKVEFDSDKLEELTLSLSDVRQAYPAEPMWAKFEDRPPAFGSIVLSNGLVSVNGPEQFSLPRDQLTGITPSGIGGIGYWSGKLNVGLSLQSGNNRLTAVSASGELARRTPNTRLLLDYLGNFSEINGTQNANNQRVNLTYDIRLDRHWFVRPAQMEYYHDPVANISFRGTAGVGAGYYIFDRDGLEWHVAAGPAYQYTQFETVEPEQPQSATTPAAVLTTYFKADLTSRLTLIESLNSTITEKEAGQYMHHSVSTLEFEIKHHLNLDVSFVWDYLHHPQAESNGEIPLKSDYYLTVGFGVRF